MVMSNPRAGPLLLAALSYGWHRGAARRVI